MQEILNQLLVAVLTIAIPFAVKAIFSLIGNLLTKWENELSMMKDGRVKSRLMEFETIVRKATMTTEATLKKELLAKAVDGKITKEEAEELMSATVRTVKATTTEDTKALLKSLGLDIEAVIRAEAESFLESLKNRFRSTDNGKVN